MEQNTGVQTPTPPESPHGVFEIFLRACARIPEVTEGPSERLEGVAAILVAYCSPSCNGEAPGGIGMPAGPGRGCGNCS